MVWYKRSLLILLSLVISARFVQAEAEKELRIPKGTSIKLRLVQPLSSATARLGDPVQLETVEEMKIDGKVIIPKGGKAQGFVGEAMSGEMWGAGRLGIWVSSVFTRTGFRVPVYGATSALAPSAVEQTASTSKEAAITPAVVVTASTELEIPLGSANSYAANEPAAATN